MGYQEVSNVCSTTQYQNVQPSRRSKFSFGRAFKSLPMALAVISSRAEAGPTPYVICMAACGAVSLASIATPACPASFALYLTCCQGCLPLFILPTP